MSEPLARYLHDHLAGAAFAVNLLDVLSRQHPDEPVGVLARGLRVEIEEDRATLKALAERICGHDSTLQDAVGWLGEKASRMKLRHQTADTLGTFESLETLALGIVGKRSLWDALATLAPADPRLAGYDFEDLAARAADQYIRVEGQRLAHVPLTFVPASASSVSPSPG